MRVAQEFVSGLHKAGISVDCAGLSEILQDQCLISSDQNY